MNVPNKFEWDGMTYTWSYGGAPGSKIPSHKITVSQKTQDAVREILNVDDLAEQCVTKILGSRHFAQQLKFEIAHWGKDGEQNLGDIQLNDILWVFNRNTTPISKEFAEAVMAPEWVIEFEKIGKFSDSADEEIRSGWREYRMSIYELASDVLAAMFEAQDSPSMALYKSLPQAYDKNVPHGNMNLYKEYDRKLSQRNGRKKKIAQPEMKGPPGGLQFSQGPPQQFAQQFSQGPPQFAQQFSQESPQFAQQGPPQRFYAYTRT